MIKKVYLLMSALTFLTGNCIMAQTQRTVLVEEFTQASCPHCPASNAYLNPFFATNAGKLVAVKYQVDFPGTDQMNLQDPADALTRANVYGIETVLGVPDVVVDGDSSKIQDPNAYTGYPLDLTQTLLNTEAAIPSPVTMTATYSYDSVTDSIFSTIIVKNVNGSTIHASATTQLRLFVSLLEMNIHFTTNPPGNNGEYDFYYVTRKMYPSAAGNILADSILNGDSIVYHLRAKAPAYIYNKKEMAVAAFVQDMGTKVVDQAVLATPGNVTDAAMTDNTVYPAATEVCNVSFTPSLTITNNGTTTLTSATVGYFIPGSNPVSQPWTGSLASGQSTTVSLATISIPDNTYSTLEYFVNNLNAGALIDINDANNQPSSSFFSTIAATATLDSLSEQFEEGSVGSVFTPISTNSTDPNDAFGFIADQNFLTSYIDNTSNSAACGGYAQSDASFFFCLACATTGQQDGLIFDKVDKTGYEENLLTFQHAYAGMSGSADKLEVQISNDCGNTWNTVWSKTGSALATSPNVDINSSGLFAPSATQWKTDSVDVSAYSHQAGVIVQFLATSQGGNGLYVDNINWALGTSTAGIHELPNTVSVNVYPNPANKLVNLSLSLTQAANFEISVVDVLGQTVKAVPAGQLPAGGNNIEVNVSNLASGLYNFVIKSNDQVLVKRFFVTK